MKDLLVGLESLESTLVLHAVGPVDSNTAPHLQEPLLHAAESPSGTVQLDSVGCSQAYQQWQEWGSALQRAIGCSSRA